MAGFRSSKTPRVPEPGSVTLAQDGVCARVADLEAKGIRIASKSEAPEGKIAIIMDLDGNQIVFAEGGDVNYRSTA